MSRVDEAVARAAAVAGAGAGAGAAAGGTAIPLGDGTPLPDVPGDELWEPETPESAEQARPELAVPIGPETFGHDVDTPRGDERLVTQWDDPRCVEQYRRLAARLHLRQAERGTKVVMVGSALPGEGKTLTAANLALTLSQSYRRQVLLIDGDLRRPWMHRLFRVSNVAGLNDGVTAKSERKIPLIRWSSHLTLVTAGRPESDPMSVLSSTRMKQIVTEAAAKFDWVIIDTPPIGLLSDANLLAALVDTVILVVQANRTPHADVQHAVQALGRENIFGIVLNRTVTKASGYYTQYYGHEPQVSD